MRPELTNAVYQQARKETVVEDAPSAEMLIRRRMLQFRRNHILSSPTTVTNEMDEQDVAMAPPADESNGELLPEDTINERLSMRLMKADREASGKILSFQQGENRSWLI